MKNIYTLSESYTFQKDLKIKHPMRTILVLSFLFFLLLLNSNANSQNIGDFRSASNGNWSVIATWERYDGTNWLPAATGQTPGTVANANVLIRDNHNVSLNVSPANALSSLTIGEGTSGIFSLNTLNINVSGLTLIKIGATLNLNGASGTKTFNDIIVNGTWNNSGNNPVTIVGNIENNGIFNSGTGAYTLSGAGKSITGTLTINNINHTGTFTNNGNLTVLTTFTSATAFTNGNNALLNINTLTPPVNLIANTPGNTVNYGGATQNIRGVDYENLTISGTGNKTLLAATTINGNLDVQSGTLVSANFQIIGNNTGTLSIADGAGLSIGNTVATLFPTNFISSNIALAANSTVTYAASVNQTVSSTPLNYGNLTLSNATTTQRIKTLDGNISILGNLFVGNYNNFTLGTNREVSISGTITLQGTLTALTGSTTTDLILNGTTNVSLPVITGNLRSLTIDKQSGTTATTTTLTLAGNLSILNGTLINAAQLTGNAVGLFTMASGSTLRIGTAGAVSFPTLFTSANITFGIGSTIIYGSTSAQSISSVKPYENLELINVSVKTVLSPGITVNGNLSIGNGTTLNDNGFQINGNTNGIFSIGSNGVLQLGIANTNNTNFPTNFLSANLFLNPTSTVIYNANAAQLVSALPTYGNLTLSATNAQVKSLSSDILIVGNLTVNANVNFNLNTSIAEINGNITLAATTSRISGSGRVVLKNGSALHQLIFSVPNITNGITNLELDDVFGARIITQQVFITENLLLTQGELELNNRGLNIDGQITSVNGKISAIAAHTASNLIINGNSGGSAGNLVMADAPNNVLSSLTINRTGANAEFSLNNDVVVKTALTLTNGNLLNSSNLTLGIGSGILTTTKVNGSLDANPIFNLTGVTYQITYGNGIATGFSIPINFEAPKSPDIISGIVTINNPISGPGGGASLTDNITVGGILTMTNGILDIANYELTLNSTITYTSGSLRGGSSSLLTFGNTGSTTLNPVTNGLSKLNINRAGTITLAAGTHLIENELILENGILRTAGSTTILTLNGIINSNFGTYTATSGVLNLFGNIGGNIGTLNLTAGNGTLTSVNFNNTGVSPFLTINGNLTLAGFALTNGIVKMGINTLTHNGAATTMTASNGSESGYFMFSNSPSAGFQWNMPASTAAGNYQWPIGFDGIFSGYRPVSIKTNSANPASSVQIKIGFIEHTGGANYTPTNIPNADNRSNIITTITVNGVAQSASIASDITLSYQNTDFNNTPSSTVGIWRHNGNWVDLGTVTSSSVNGNATITKTAAFPLALGNYILIPSDGVNDPTPTGFTIWVGSVSNAWNLAANWSPSVVPNASADVIIDNPSAAFQPVINTTANVRNITIGNGSSLTLGAFVFTINGEANNFGNIILPTSTTASTVTYAGNSAQTIMPGNYFNLNSTGTGDRLLPSSGTVFIAGTFTKGANNYILPGTSIVEFNGTAARTFSGPFSFDNLAVSSTNTLTINTGNISVNNDLTINSGTLISSGTVLINGPGSSSGTFSNFSNFTMNGTAIGITPNNIGMFPVFANYNFSNNSNTSYTGNAMLPIAGNIAYGNLIITTATATNVKTVTDDIVVKGNLNVTSAASILYYETHDITVFGNITNNGKISGSAGGAGTGKILVTNGTANHVITSTISGSIYGNLEINDSNFQSTINNPTVTTAISTIQGNLIVSNGQFVINNFTTSFTVSGNTQILPSAEIIIGNVTGTKNFTGDFLNEGIWTNNVNELITFSGNFTNNGTFISGTGSYTFVGASKFFDGTNPITITNVSITNATGYINNGILEVNTLSGGGKITAGTNSLINFSNNGSGNVFSITTADLTSNTPNTVMYSGTVAQTVRGGSGLNTYSNLVIDKPSNTATLGTAAFINGDLTIERGAFSNGTFLMTGPGLSSGKTFTIKNSGSYTMSVANANPMPAFEFYNFDANSTVTYNTVTTAINISALNGSPYGNLTLINTGNKTALGDITVEGNFTNTSSTFNIGNGNTITFKGNVTSNTAFVGFAGPTSNLVYEGIGNANVPSVTNNLNNLTINRTGTVSLSGNLGVNGTLHLSQGEISLSNRILTLSGDVNSTASGTIGSLSNNGTLVLAGTAGGNMGTLNLTNGTQTLSALTFSRTGTTPSVTINGNLNLSGIFTLNSPGGILNFNGDVNLGSSFTLTNGIANMGSNMVLYSSVTTTPFTSTNINNSYFSFINNGGLQWNMNNIAAGTYRWPIGSSGTVNGFRPVTIQTLSSGANASVKIGFINHDGTNVVSETEVPTSGNNRVNYIANINVISGSLPSSNLTFAYQAADFNGVAPPAVNLAFYRFDSNLSEWSKLGASTGGTANGNLTLIQNNVLLSGTNAVVIGEIGGTDLPSTTVFTWVGNVSSAWNNPLNWSPNSSFPQLNTDIVFINNPTASFQPTLTTTIAVKDLTVSNGQTLTLASGGNISVFGGFINNAIVEPLAGSTVNYAGNIHQVILPLNYATLISSGTGSRTLSNSGIIGIATVFTTGTNTYNTSGSTVNFNGSGNQTIPVTNATFEYHHLQFSNNGLKTLAAGNITVNGNIDINGNATLVNPVSTSILALGGTFTIGDGASFTTARTAAPWFPTNMTVSLHDNSTVNFNPATATVYNSSGNIPNVFGNLSFGGGAVVKTLPTGFPILVKSNLSISTASGLLADNNNIITVNGNVNNIGGISGNGTILLAGGNSTHILNGTGAYRNVVLDDVLGVTITSNTTISVSFIINNGTVTLPNFTFVSTGTTNLNNGEILITGASGSKNFGDLTIAGGTAVNINAPAVLSTRQLIIEPGGEWNNNGNTNATISGMFQNDGLFVSGTGQYTMSGTAQIITGINPIEVNNLVISGTITNQNSLTAFGAVAVNGTLINQSVFNIEGAIAISGIGTINNATASSIFNTKSISITPTIIATAVGNVVHYNGVSAAQIVKPTSYNILNLNNQSGLTNTISNVTNNGTMNLNSGSWQIGNATLTFNGDLNIVSGNLIGGTTSRITVGGTSATHFNLPEITNHLLNLTINRPNGVSLNAPLNIGTATTGVLTLTNGRLFTTNTNLLTILNTNTAAISGGNNNSYIVGPLERILPTSLSAVATYTFPVGADISPSLLSLIELIDPKTDASGTVSVKAQYFNTSPLGTSGTAFDISNANKYWQITVGGSGNLSSFGTVRLTDSPAPINKAIGYSTQSNGAFNNLGGVVSGSTISSIVEAPNGNAENFFTIGESGCLGNALAPTFFTVGTNQQFQRLTDVSKILNAAIICGDLVFEIQNDYLGNNETFPIQFNQFNYNGGPWNITIRPATGVTNIVTAGTPASGVHFIHLNGADKLTFDGRPGGVGSNIEWLLRNTRNAASYTPVFFFNNDATNDTLRFLQIESQNALASSGSVFISTAGAVSGNDNLVIENNIIRDRSDAAGSPFNAVFSNGTSGRPNNNISILNNKIFNFNNNAAGGVAAGINIGNFNADYVIADNEIYQEKIFNTASAHHGIIINATSVNGFRIINNKIGGNGNGGKWTNNTTGLDYRFCGISFSGGISNNDTIRGNVIKDFDFITGTAFQTQSSTFTGILASNGAPFIIENTIGSITEPANINIALSSAALTSVLGIFHSGNDEIRVANNTVGGFTISNPTSSAFITNLYGIRVGTSSISKSISVENNIVGSSTAGLINQTGNTYNSTGTIYTAGIFAEGARPINLINNQISNIRYTANGNATTGRVQTMGIFRAVSGGGAIAGTNAVIVDNIIQEVSSSSPYIGSGTSSSVAGLLFSSASNGHLISNNQIKNIKNISLSAASKVVGLYYRSATSGVNIIEKNLIHSLSSSSSNGSAFITGLQIETGNATFQNNMIAMGFDADANSLDNAYSINGISVAAGTSTFYFNSVFVGGNSVTSNNNSNAFLSTSTSTVSRSIQNNIFWNNRNTVNGNGKNYAINLNNITNLNSDYNDLFADNLSGIIGAVASIDFLGLNDWQINNLDLNSVSGNPQFINPFGDANSLNLHINSSVATPIEGSGILIGGINNDIDGDDRALLSPTDMGADAGDFIGKDINPPVFANTNIASICNDASEVQIQNVVISDISGVDVSPGFGPRLYYKKTTQPNSLAAWQFVPANNNDFDFTINLSSLGTVSPGDVIEYFYVAQDANIPASVGASSGTFNIAPSSVNLDVDAFPINGTLPSFTILPCNGNITIGIAETYTGLTPNGGIFETINNLPNGLNGNLTIQINSDLALEDGANALTNAKLNGFKIRIVPADASQKIISNVTNLSVPMIPLNGAQQVSIDGSFNGVGKFLLFRNTHTSSASAQAVFHYFGGVSSDSLLNLVVESNASSTVRGALVVGTGSNSGLVISKNSFTGSNGGTLGNYANAIFSSNASNTVEIIENEIVNSTNSAILLSNGNSWNIINNKFYQTITASTAQSVINVLNGNGHVIKNNRIGGNDANGNGVWINNGNVVVNGISLVTSTSGVPSILDNNIIENFSLTGTLASSFNGINATTGLSIIGLDDGNIIRNISTNGTGILSGISSSSGTLIRTIQKNKVYNLANNSNATTTLRGIFSNGTNTSNAINKNFIYNLKGSNANSPIVNGIQISGAGNLENNMVRLGFDENGNSISNATQFTGILKEGTAGVNVWHNSVYIGGNTLSTTATNTYAFRRTANSISNIQNNIFVNERENLSTGGKHISLDINGITSLTLDFNIYASSSGNTFGLLSGSSIFSNLQAWNTNFPSLDFSSGVGNPNFIDPTGVTPDLHITTPSPAEGSGTNTISTSDDFDGEDRSINSPTDIGADAENVSNEDIFAPKVTVNIVANQAICAGNVSVEILANVTEIGQSGIASGILAPTLWWRESSSSVWNSQLANQVIGNVYSFTLTISGVLPGQIYQYYVAAQDQANIPNIGYSNFSATTPLHTDVSTSPSVENTNPASFTVSALAPLAGNISVGSGGDFTTLSATGGLFEAINSRGLSSDLIVTIISNTSETGAVQLNEYTSHCGGVFSIFIQPDGTTTRILSGNYSGPQGIITFNGADRVIIDGSFNGDGLQHLHFLNTATAFSPISGSATLFYYNDATNHVIKHSIIEGHTHANSGGVPTAGVVTLFNGISSGNDFIEFESNLIAGTLSGGGANAATVLLLSQGSSASVANNNITVKNNSFKDFSVWNSNQNGSISARSYGLHVTGIGNGSNWEITGNSFYLTFPENQSQWTALSFQPGQNSTNNIISGNFIGGSAPEAGSCTSCAFPYMGATFQPNAETQFQGMAINAGEVNIRENIFKKIWIRNTNYSGFVAMLIQGNTIAQISKNELGGQGTQSFSQSTNSDYIQVDGGALSGGVGPGYIFGIWTQGNVTLNADSNIFYTLFQTGNNVNLGGNVQCITHQASGVAVITNNNIANPNAAGRNFNSYAIRLEPTANTSGNRIENNLITGPSVIGGTTALGVITGGIYVNHLNGRNISGIIANNTVFALNSTQANGWLRGIYLNGNTSGNGTWEITNNMIYLDNRGTTAQLSVNGIDVAMNASSNITVAYNTVWIAGTQTGTSANNSFAFWKFSGSSGSVSGGTTFLRNNILMNTRSGNSSSFNVALGNQGSSNFATGWNSNNNFVFSGGGTNTNVGVWGNSVYSTLPLFQSAPGNTGDINSFSATHTVGASNFTNELLNPNNLFKNINTGDLHISIVDAESFQFVNNRAQVIATSIDIDQEIRNASTPDLGADEFEICSPPTIANHPANSTINVGGSTLFTSTVNGFSPNFQWQVSTDNGVSWNNLSDGGVYAGTTNDALQINGVDMSLNNFQFRLIATNTCGADTSNSALLTINPCIVGNWNGNVDNLWFNPDNWDCGIIPNNTTPVVIPGGRPHYPNFYHDGTVNVFGNPEAGTIEIQNSGSILLTNGVTLHVSGLIRIQNGATLQLSTDTASTIILEGNWDNHGTFAHGNGNVIFDGINPATLKSNNQDFYNLVINKTNSASKVNVSLDNVKAAFVSIANGELDVEAGRTVDTEKGEVLNGAKLNIQTNAVFKVDR